MAGFGKLALANLERPIVTGLQFGNAGGVDIEADHRTVLPEFHGQRQAHIAKTDDGDFCLIEVHARKRETYCICEPGLMTVSRA
ncbi:hypothetical protein D3C86_1857920 [compost metagenome]